MTDQELDRILTDLKSDDGSHLGSVRARVMAQIDAGSRRGKALVWWTLAAAAALVTVGLWIPRASEPLPLVVTPPAPPVMAFSEPRPARLRPQPRIASRAVSRPALKATTLEVRMQTDDPDVLIIWLVDGDEEDQKGNQ